MNEKVEAVVEYIQKNCLWQFFSRSWDRADNIDGILTKAGKFLRGNLPLKKPLQINAGLQTQKILIAELKVKIPWFASADKKEVKEILNGVKERMREIAIDKSKNEELKIPNY